MKNRDIQTVSSKLIKTRLLLGGKLAIHVPAAAPFSGAGLKEMLGKYGMVYVKPDTGSQGVGIMRVERRAKGRYRYQAGLERFEFDTYAGMYRSLRRGMGKRRHLIQQGVRVLRHEGRPFDFRVMAQKNAAGRWDVTGIAGRVAHPGKIVSNGSQGGSIFEAMRLLGPAAGRTGAVRAIGAMRRLALLTAGRFGSEYPAMNELGIDIAVDRGMKPWILEVNTRPDPCPFAKLEDRTAIRRIVRYGRRYGRRYCLKCGKAKTGT
ncbi:YheC/YheD family protein [Cohnella rhizosphaerae]|uniref:YheC/YheD family protein n=1 Tax=Cohnella rhizosphaerae TaxID=1457232 RepID=A0A9X4QSD9_9BACL|nr:YheC/YheD family protein [Cohnella rhizosphaerae]MDG0809500.1 YheC/YheD family protein [Cohnella rhizosphaerae]